MHVLVIREFVYGNEDLRIVMVARGGILSEISMISPVVMLKGAAPYANGNPYGIYGDACAKFTGKDKFDLSITVAGCTSGDLSGW